jgi:hypothetical protein
VNNSAIALQTVKTLDAYVANIRYFINRANSDLSKAEEGKAQLSSSIKASAK